MEFEKQKIEFPKSKYPNLNSHKVYPEESMLKLIHVKLDSFS